jgi:hypothetical protein
MTIFHVLKYHISNPPTAEELQALPPDILERWCKEIKFNIRAVRNPHTILARYFELESNQNRDSRWLNQLANLRTILKRMRR